MNINETNTAFHGGIWTMRHTFLPADSYSVVWVAWRARWSDAGLTVRGVWC